MADQPRRANRRKRRPEHREPAAPKGGPDAMRAGYAKSEIKNQKVRDSLVPLEPGERPTAVTVGAIFAVVVALLLWGSTVVALVTDAEVNGKQVNVIQWAALAGIFTMMAWGMWNARYWAVLGFQMMLVLLILASVLGLVIAATLLQMVSTAILAIGLSTLFFFMVKAMARIQMPDRPGQR